MAVDDEWEQVERRFAQLEQYTVVHPTLAAMRRLVELIRSDPALADVHPVVSLASLVLARGSAARRVSVAWHEHRGYEVAFIDPPLEVSETTFVPEAAVLGAVRDYVDRL